MILKQKQPMPKCLSGIAKYHTHTGRTDHLVSEAVRQSWYVKAAYAKANAIPFIPKKNKPIAGGGMQVCSLAAIDELSGGVYVDKNKSKDKNLLRDGQRARSDIQFRKRMGGSLMVNLPAQIHLNHCRDKEAGKHLEDQR